MNPSALPRFLDEIGDMLLELQPKMLRVLQEHEFEASGNAGKRSNQTPTDSIKGSSRAASSFSATSRPLATFRPSSLDDLLDSCGHHFGRIEQWDVIHACLANSACMPILYSL
jgi:hypothetical protein